MSYEDELFEKIVRLECRLANYHEQLEQALEDDRETQLEMTWSIVGAVAGPLAMIGVVGLSRFAFGELQGLAVGLLFVAALAALIAAYVACDRARNKWLTKMARLPGWRVP